MNIRHKFFTVAAISIAFASIPAQADVYKCIDAEGHVTYTNARNVGKGCKVLTQDKAVSTVPSQRAAPSPAGFPKVDAEKQKARDTDRRRILDEELATEQKNLEQARKELVEQEGIVLPQERTQSGINGAKVQERIQPYKDSVALHERNLEALKKEIGNLR
jgi:hypothetical protein